MLFRPFVPTQGDNQQMTAFMVAKSDPGHYGELETFQMPSNNLPPSPTLVASTMTSDTERRGLADTARRARRRIGSVCSATCIIVPIEQSLLYVRPVYVQTTGENNPPLLRKVIVLYKGQVQVADTLPQALQLFPDFSEPVRSDADEPDPTDEPHAADEPHEPDPTDESDPADADAGSVAPAGDRCVRAAADAALKKDPPDYATYGQQLALAQR